MTRTLVYGLALAGDALASELCRRGHEVVVTDDTPTPAKLARAAELGARWVDAPAGAATAASLLGSVDQLCPAPGVPETHPVIVAAEAAGVPIRTEIDLAYEFEQDRPGGPRPILAVTGTDGKTTTTLMTAHLLNAAGRRALAVGNTEVPFVAELGSDAEVFVVECSSFRLNWLRSFRAEASVWLNFAPDHLNWHRDLAAYERAKANLWANLRATDVAVGDAGDPVVMANLARCAGRHITVAAAGHADYHVDYHADYHVEDGVLIGPHGPICHRSAMSRDLPHDVSNALAAAAMVIESGLLDAAQVAAGLASFRHPPHRIEFVADVGGVRWYNDSKATSPHAALPAIRSFPSVVLIAGGLNKDLDLGELAGGADHVRAVVAIGLAAGEIEAAFHGVRPVVPVTTSMADAVAAAARLAEPGDTVLLSPACASFDWYPGGGYPARGEDFRRCVAELAAVRS